LLLGLIAVASVAVLHAMGALLAGALLVIPAATTRFFFDRMLAWQIATVILVLIEGAGGLVLSVELNAPPGATIAAIGGGVFLVAAVLRAYEHLLPARAPLLGATALAVVALAGCGSASNGGDKPKVVASTTILGDMTRQIAGPDFDVQQVLQPNSDPHTYEPRPADVKAIASANLVLASGLGLDRFMNTSVKSSGTSAKLDEVGDVVKHPLTGFDEGPTGQDPHWWQNPRNAEFVADEIAKQLKAIAPQHTAEIDRRVARYKKQIARVDGEIASCIEKVPLNERKFVTSHDAFGYYARRYGIKVVGAVIPATTTQAQPNAGDLARLSRTIRAQHVKAIFPEQALNKKLTDAIARQTGARSDLVLYGDALGPVGSAGDTYLKLLATNTERIAIGFSGGSRHCSIKP
jgi:ABC-type Zn uptake system ZnuABC Zn-binding protein ZnuA